jgi:hypothetical protein
MMMFHTLCGSLNDFLRLSVIAILEGGHSFSSQTQKAGLSKSQPKNKVSQKSSTVRGVARSTHESQTQPVQCLQASLSVPGVLPEVLVAFAKNPEDVTLRALVNASLTPTQEMSVSSTPEGPSERPAPASAPDHVGNNVFDSVQARPGRPSQKEETRAMPSSRLENDSDTAAAAIGGVAGEYETDEVVESGEVAGDRMAEKKDVQKFMLTWMSQRSESADDHGFESCDLVKKWIDGEDRKCMSAVSFDSTHNSRICNPFFFKSPPKSSIVRLPTTGKCERR